MGDTNGSKHSHFLKNLKRKQPKAGDKIKKTTNRYIDLLKKQAKEGDTKWVQNALQKANAKLKKYSITKTNIRKRLEEKGLKDLAGKLN